MWPLGFSENTSAWYGTRTAVLFTTSVKVPILSMNRFGGGLFDERPTTQ